MNFDEFSKQIDDCINKYSGLEIILKNDAIVLNGDFILDATYNCVSIFDIYTIKIEVTSNFPNSIPTVYELSQKIPRDFQHKYDNNECCLGVEGELIMKLSNTPTILGFIDNILVDFLFSSSHYIRYGFFPFGERKHGGEGVLSFYKEYFEVEDSKKATDLLYLAVNNKYRGHLMCPCESGMKLRNCHGAKVRRICECNNENFKRDLIQILIFLNERR